MLAHDSQDQSKPQTPSHAVRAPCGPTCHEPTDAIVNRVLDALVAAVDFGGLNGLSYADVAWVACRLDDEP